MAKAVLDASALLAYLNGEPGAEMVASFIGEALISTVNVAEVVTKLVERSGSPDVAAQALAIIDIDIVDFDRRQAEAVGGLVTLTRSKGLSLGDRACLCLAAREKLPALTADRNWQELKLGTEVRLVR
jgi:ribonuclease VapC